MARGRKPRTWIKLYPEGVLRGSINYLLSLEGQAIWLKILCLSEVSGGRAGYIEDNNQNGLPHEYIAQELHCSPELFEYVLDIMIKDGAVGINGTGSIQIVNFTAYQATEYDRQKPYREAKKAETDSEKFKGGRYGHMVQ